MTEQTHDATVALVVATTSDAVDLRGLTTTQVDIERAAGRVNGSPPDTTRTVGSIVRSNIFTRFNVVLVATFIVIIVIGHVRDSVFIWVVVGNAAIGIVQELRARRALNRLHVLDATKVTVVRNGETQVIDPADIVAGDLIQMQRGDAVPVDGTVVSGGPVQADESMLTGESEPVTKVSGSELMSGSVLLAGSATIRADRVGTEAYARRLTDYARQFTLTRSELRSGLDRILSVVTWGLVPTSALLVWSQVRASASWRDAAAASVAGVVAMIPEGLVLLASVAMAAGAVRLSRHRVLTRELAAVEGLARVDVVCIDKTGTLTSSGLRFDRFVPASNLIDEDDLVCAGRAAAAVAATDTARNPTAEALRTAFEPADWAVTASQPLSSRTKWSAAEFAEAGTWVIGAFEIVLAEPAIDPSICERAEGLARSGHRVLAVARTDARLANDSLPVGLVPVAFAVLTEQIKPDAAETIRFFADQGVAVKIISGDSPLTVAAVADQLAIAVTGPIVDASRLPPDPHAIASMIESNVFGRVTPEHKREIVAELQRLGHTVAMLGDGINDLLALKQADIGVAMGSGSAASRQVAQFVLLDDNFATFPTIVAEGRRVIGNIERVAIACWTLSLPIRPLMVRHVAILITMTASFATIVLILSARRWFGFAIPPSSQMASIVAVIAVAVGLLELRLWWGLRSARPG